jgi:hypothetical protein
VLPIIWPEGVDTTRVSTIGVVNEGKDEVAVGQAQGVLWREGERAAGERLTLNRELRWHPRLDESSPTPVRGHDPAPF